jgi:ABC-2 type transport system permease protein
MSALIQSELFKLRTARSYVVLTCLGAGLALAACVLDASLTTYDKGSTPGVNQISNAGIIHIFLLMLGVLAVTAEYRHGSIASALLIEPDRRRLLAAKLIAVTAVGLLVSLVMAGASLGIGAAILPARGFSLGLGTRETFELIAGTVVAGGLVAMLGCGIGALVRKQTPAIVGIFVYLFVLEPVLTGLLIKSASKYSLGSAMSEITATTSSGTINGLEAPLGQVAGGLVLAAWAVAFALIGAAVMQARDISD